VVADLGQAVLRQVLDVFVMRLFRPTVDVFVQALVGLPVVGLGIVLGPDPDLILIDPDLAVLHPGIESLQTFRRIVGAHTGFVAVVPVMHAAHQISAFYMAIRHQRATVQTASIEHRNLVFFL
jgi:hypothetical protein